MHIWLIAERKVNCWWKRGNVEMEQQQRRAEPPPPPTSLRESGAQTEGRWSARGRGGAQTTA